jgi:hypothetical protein
MPPSAVCSTCWCLVSLAREVAAGDRVLSGLPDSRKQELARWLVLDADVLRDNESAGTALFAHDTVDIFKTPRWWRRTGRRAVVTRCVCAAHSWHQAQFQTRILDSGWIQGVCADILSHTWHLAGTWW